MTIKITGLQLEKRSYTSTGKLESFINGNLQLEVESNRVKANTNYKLSNVSNKLHKKLISVLHEIEDELNGVKSSYTSFDNEESGRKVVIDGSVDFTDTKVILPKGEYIIPKVDAEELMKISESLPEILKDAEKYLNKYIKKAKDIYFDSELQKSYTDEQKDNLMFGIGLLSKILEDGLK